MTVSISFAKSKSASDMNPAQVLELVHRHLPDCLGCHRAHDSNDKGGIDYWLEFRHGRMEALDLKSWSRDTAINLETIGSMGKAGWSVSDPVAAWYLFYFRDTDRTELHAARLFHAAVAANLDRWRHLERTNTPTIGNHGDRWQSRFIPLPSRELWAAVYRHCTGLQKHHSATNAATPSPTPNRPAENAAIGELKAAA